MDGTEAHTNLRAKFILGNQASKFPDVLAADMSLVYYTSAETFFRIVDSQAIYLRNARHMNDYRELKHGLEAYSAFLTGGDAGAIALIAALAQIDRGIANVVIEWLTKFESELLHTTYMLCLSEHARSEDRIGRLSMWRGYGGTGVAVAMVLNKNVVIDDNDYGVETYPVDYAHSYEIHAQMEELVDFLNSEQEALRSWTSREVADCLIRRLLLTASTRKHPGFLEEREWRVLYWPRLRPSAGLESVKRQESIGGLPQTVYPLPLDGRIMNGGFAIRFQDVVEAVIVGPCADEVPILEAIREKIKEITPHKDIPVYHCGIPYRAKF